MATESVLPMDIDEPVAALNPQGAVAGDIKGRLPENIADYKAEAFDPGVFQYEMLKLAIVPEAPPQYEDVVNQPEADPRVEGVLEGTFGGTQKAIAEAFTMVEGQFMTLYNIAQIDTIFPRADDIPTKRQIYQWSTEHDEVIRNRRASKLPQRDDKREWLYPPHCRAVPPGNLEDLQEAQKIRRKLREEEKAKDPDFVDPLEVLDYDIIDPVKGVPMDQVFDLLALKNVRMIIPKIVPIKIKDFNITGYLPNFIKKGVDYVRYQAVLPEFMGLDDKYGGKGVPTKATTIEDIRIFCQNQRNSDKEDRRAAYLDPNICDREDWYTDAVFGQQQFTGVNPTTIEIVSQKFLEEFIAAAKAQKRNDIVELLTSNSREAFYMQDCSYFRKAIRVNPTADIVVEDELNGDKYKRWNAASVTLFHLPEDGRLHPLAIVLDYKDTMKNSVTVFNKRIKAHHILNEPAPGEKEDWPWRYAKTVSQSADWLRHEIGVHLTNTHLVEEAVIVATQRSFEWNHIILRLLYPHWFKTLPLNEGARTILVPMIIADIIGLSAEQAEDLIAYHYNTFDFKATYVPNDLTRRGFPLDPLRDNATNNRFTNYGYAKNILPLWDIIRRFISSMLSMFYLTDEQVSSDISIKRWIRELRGVAGGRLTSFPETISTRDELIDVITNCIHIASPLHTAVNYLQQYHMSWILNKPSCLCAPLPKSLSDYNSITEFHLVQTLPTFRPRDWLLASHVPYLLSIRTTARTNSIALYAASLFNVYKDKKTVKDEFKDYRGDEHAGQIREAAKRFYDELREFDFLWPEISNNMWDASVSYNVLDPDDTAVSILI